MILIFETGTPKRSQKLVRALIGMLMRMLEVGVQYAQRSKGTEAIDRSDNKKALVAHVREHHVK